MKSTYPPFRLLRMIGQFAACAVTGVTLACAMTLPARADQLDQHDSLVNQYIQMHASPLVADCAAHGSFIAGTSSAIDHVEFTPSSFDSTHSSVTPWNDAFDQGKQHIRVDTVVTVSGAGIPRSGDAPLDLKFRCGYVDHQMMAFSWNDPVPAARRISGEPGAYVVHPTSSVHRVCRRRGHHHRCEYVRTYERHHVAYAHESHGKRAARITKRTTVRHHDKTVARKHTGTKKHHVARKRRAAN